MSEKTTASQWILLKVYLLYLEKLKRTLKLLQLTIQYRHKEPWTCTYQPYRVQIVPGTVPGCAIHTTANVDFCIHQASDKRPRAEVHLEKKLPFPWLILTHVWKGLMAVDVIWWPREGPILQLHLPSNLKLLIYPWCLISVVPFHNYECF